VTTKEWVVVAVRLQMMEMHLRGSHRSFHGRDAAVGPGDGDDDNGGERNGCGGGAVRDVAAGCQPATCPPTAPHHPPLLAGAGDAIEGPDLSEAALWRHDELGGEEFARRTQLKDSLSSVSQHGQLLGRRGCISPANAGGFDTHRDTITCRGCLTLGWVGPSRGRPRPLCHAGRLRCISTGRLTRGRAGCPLRPLPQIWNRERGLSHDKVGGARGGGTFVHSWGMGFHGQLGKDFRRGEVRSFSTPMQVQLLSS
jgi:hypothetical protein